MNPDVPESKPFFNRLLQGFVGNRRSRGKTKSASAKQAEVLKRRKKNKMGYRSRRKNRILAKNLHHKLVN